jgi:hypothetical protein
LDGEITSTGLEYNNSQIYLSLKHISIISILIAPTTVCYFAIFGTITYFE